MNILKKTLALVMAAGLLAGGTAAYPQPPTPVAPTPPAVPTTPGPVQYGTPFGSVPNREDAVIYQVNMRAFSPSGNFAGVTARLDSMKAIGVNVLYLMPIYPVGVVKSVNSPYCVKDYTAVNSEFGTLTDLRTLVDGAHARGLAVMLDWVANHTSYDNAWLTAHPDWYLRNRAGTILSPPNTNYTDVAQLDFTNASMRLAMIAAMKSWVYTANIDGFRCDYADPIPASFWVQAIDTLRNIKSHKLLLLAEGSNSSNFKSGFDYTFGFGFYGGLRSVYGRKGAATTFTTLTASEYRGAATTQQVVRYTTNHDVNGSDGTPVALFGGNAGAMSAFVVASCFEGVPFVYSGQEVGMTAPITFPFTSVKIKWGAHSDVKRAYQQLLMARAASPALQHGTPVAYSTADVCAFTKTAGTDQALVLVNVRNVPSTYTVPTALANTAWTNALQGGTYTVGSQVALPPYGYVVLRK